MSKLDYSKWDKLELSDDDDFECHPNVDKASFIRWRQQDIHQKRLERREQLNGLQGEKAMNAALIERLQRLLADVDRSVASPEDLHRLAMQYREQGRAPDAARHGDGPAFDEMIAVLLMQIESAGRSGMLNTASDNPQQWYKDQMKQHLDKLEARQAEVIEQYAALLEEESSKLTSDNMYHEGFNRTIIHKDKEGDGKKSKSVKEKTTTIEVLNPGQTTDDKTPAASESESKAKESTADDDDSDEEINMSIETEEAREFAEATSYEDSYRLLKKSPWMATQPIADQIIAEAFEFELTGKSAHAERYVRQAKVLEYCKEIGHARGVDLFFSRLLGPGEHARQVFEHDVSRIYAHIKSRCPIIRAEQTARKEARERVLSNADPSEPIEITVPETATDADHARVAAFKSFPPAFQHALLSGDLNAVNEALQGIESEEETDRILQLCKETGLLDIGDEVLEEEDEDEEENNEAEKDTTPTE